MDPQGTNIRIASYFSPMSGDVKKHWCKVLKQERENRIKSRFLYHMKLLNNFH